MNKSSETNTGHPTTAGKQPNTINHPTNSLYSDIYHNPEERWCREKKNSTTTTRNNVRVMR